MSLPSFPFPSLNFLKSHLLRYILSRNVFTRAFDIKIGYCGENRHSMYVCELNANGKPVWTYDEETGDTGAGNGCAVSISKILA